MNTLNHGKLIVIEGVDGSGKATQTQMLYERLLAEKYKIKKLHYPRYDNPSSIFVKMYLNGEFGKDAKDVSPYIASTFYAVDRYVSYKQDYEEFYNSGGIVIADRYTTANMVHQAGKIYDAQERDKFLKWLWDFEFELYKIPVPNLVCFLDIPVEFNERLMEGRTNKDPERKKKDIHESDITHLRDSYNNARDLVDMYGWTSINCIKDNMLRSTEDIHEEIYKTAIDVINNK